MGRENNLTKAKERVSVCVAGRGVVVEVSKGGGQENSCNNVTTKKMFN